MGLFWGKIHFYSGIQTKKCFLVSSKTDWKKAETAKILDPHSEQVCYLSFLHICI